MNLLEAIRHAEDSATSHRDLFARLSDICRLRFSQSLLGHVFGPKVEERLDAIEKRLSELEKT